MIIPDLIFTRLQAKQPEEAIKLLVTPLISKGYVMPEYLSDIIEREKKSPTGLPVGTLGVAIPHADPEHVINTSTAIGIFQQPILFGEMGSFDKFCKVDFVMVLAIKEPDAVVPFLQESCVMFQDTTFMAEIKSCSDKKMISEMLNSRLHGLI